jgi:hypothetical protein
METPAYKVIAPFDMLVIAALVVAAIIFFPLMQSHAGTDAAIYRDNTMVARYPLDENRIFSVQGAVGEMSIEIRDGHVRVKASACPRSLCVQHTPVSKPYEGIVCVPNHVLVQIESKGLAVQTDAVTR